MNHQAKTKKAPGNALENRVSWTPDLLADLGTAIDLEIANRYGTTKSTITKKRLALGIPPYKDPNSSRTRGLYTPDVIATFGTDTDRAIAKKLGVSKEAVKKKRQRAGIPQHTGTESQSIDALFTPEVIELLGVLSDCKIADQLGCDSESVRARRVALGIEPVIKITKLPSEAFVLLGTMPDRQIAKKFSVGINAVGNKRRSLGIPKFLPPSSNAN